MDLLKKDPLQRAAPVNERGRRLPGKVATLTYGPQRLCILLGASLGR